MAHGRLRRTVPLARLATRSASVAAMSAIRGTGDAAAIEFHHKMADRYAEALGQSKGALMKLGQMLSFTAVSSMVPPELQAIYQAALARLRTEAPPMKPELAQAVLEHELEAPVYEIFLEFDWDPLAAASIGQVHAAMLHDGRAVAVKIQYPGIAEAVRADLRNVELLASFLTLTVGGLFLRGQRLGLRNVAREIGARIEEELDYRLEAGNQAEFASLFRGHPFIHVPDVIGELCTTRVLTQQLAHGRAWEEALTAEQKLRDQWAEAIHRFVMGTYCRYGLFNADPHPGNFLFHNDGSVTCLDFGSVKRLRRDQVEMLIEIFRQVLHGDVLGTWQASVEAGVWRSSDPVTPEEAFAYWREDNALLWAEERFVATPEYAARSIQRRFSPGGPSSNALQYCTIPPEYTYMARIEIALASIIGHLRAGNLWGSFPAEYCEGAAPETEMGRRERAFHDARSATT